MKKFLALLATLTLLLGCLPAAQAAAGDTQILTVPMGVRDSENLAPLAMDVDGDTLYLLQGNGTLSVMKAGETEMKPYITGLTTDRLLYGADEPDTDHCVTAIFVRDGVITCFSSTRMTIFTLAPDEAGKPVYGETVKVQLDEEYWNEEYEYFQISFQEFEMAGDMIYATGWDQLYGSDEQVFGINVKTGEFHALDIPRVQAWGRYGADKLLLLPVDYDTMYDDDGNELPQPLSILDPATETLTELVRIKLPERYYSLRSLVYDSENDTIYMIYDNKVYRVVGGQAPELCAYHPLSDMYNINRAGVLVGSQLAIGGDYGVYLRTPDPAQLPTQTLSIGGHYGDLASTKAAAMMPDVPIFYNSDSYFSSAQALGEALSAGADIDILTVGVSWIDFQRLIDKGYCYDLSGSQTLMNYVERMYPFLQTPVLQNGKLYGIPSEMYGDCYGYNAEVFQKLNLTPPTTWIEFMDIINWFTSEENEELWADYALFEDPYDMTTVIFREILSSYEQAMLRSGQPLKLDTPIFRALMGKWETLDLSEVTLTDEQMWDESGSPTDDYQEMMKKEPLFSSYCDIGLYGLGRYTPMILQLSDDGSLPVVPELDVSVTFVNPRSESIEAAVQYLENLSQCQDVRDLMQYMPDMNEPVLNEYYEENLKNYDREIASLEKQITEAEAIDKPDLEASLAQMKEWRAQYEETGRYSISEAMIAAYRQQVENADYARLSVLNNDEDGSFYTLEERYMQGQTKLDGFIAEGDSKLRLMQGVSK